MPAEELVAHLNRHLRTTEEAEEHVCAGDECIDTMRDEMTH